MKNKDNSPIISKEFSMNEIKKHLYIKKIKERKYYYIKGKIDRKLKEVYVGPVDYTEKELKIHYCFARRKLFSNMFKAFYDLAKQKYNIKFLSKKDLRKLEFLRFGYNTILKQFDTYDLERYEENVYTKYVYGTTSIEGNTYTLIETQLTLNEGLTVSGKEKREFYEIENYNKLKEYTDKLKDIKLDIKFIKKIHSIILGNIDSDSAGEFRTKEVGISGTEFKPVKPELIEKELKKLIQEYHDNKETRHTVELACLFHQRFEEIHPFPDGNGRVGRELLRLILKRNGFPTVYIGPKEREKYLNCLDRGNFGEHRSLCKFITKNLLDFHESLFKRAKESLDVSGDRVKSNCNECSNEKKCNLWLKKFIKKMN